VKPFATLTKVDGVNSSELELAARLTPDELVMYFDRRPTVERAVRANRDAAFDPPEPVDLPADSSEVSLTTDQLTVYFMMPLPPVGEHTGIFVAKRATLDGGFSDPSLILSLVSGANGAATPFVSAAGDELFFVREGTSFDIWRAPLLDDGGAGPATPVDSVNTAFLEYNPVLSFDGLSLFYYTQRPEAADAGSVWVARRDSRTASFREPVPVTIPGAEARTDVIPTWLSPDNCRLYVSAGSADTATDIWVAERTP
jgi:hypothetical protein